MTGVVILAAGYSYRMGQPKQLMPCKGVSLLQLAINAAMDSGSRPVLVILGAHYEAILPTLTDKEITILYNNNWEEGMASSIRQGIQHLQTDSKISKVILMLCDQPFVDASILESLVSTQAKTGKKIVSCFFSNTNGPPVLFDRSFFEELLLLKGDEGAKKLLINHSSELSTVNFPLGANDIDTINDYNKLVGK